MAASVELDWRTSLLFTVASSVESRSFATIGDSPVQEVEVRKAWEKLTRWGREIISRGFA